MNFPCVSRLFDSYRLTSISCFLKFISRADLPFQVKRSSWIFVEILPFGFNIIKSEHDTYLAVDHSLFYSYSVPHSWKQNLSYRKTKTSELLLIKYIRITKLFVIESQHPASPL